MRLHCPSISDGEDSTRGLHFPQRRYFTPFIGKILKKKSTRNRIPDESPVYSISTGRISKSSQTAIFSSGVRNGWKLYMSFEPRMDTGALKWWNVSLPRKAANCPSLEMSWRPVKELHLVAFAVPAAAGALQIRALV